MWNVDNFNFVIEIDRENSGACVRARAHIHVTTDEFGEFGRCQTAKGRARPGRFAGRVYALSRLKFVPLHARRGAARRESKGESGPRSGAARRGAAILC